MEDKLRKLREAMEVLLKLDVDFTIKRLEILCVVAEKGPITSAEISDMVGLFPANTGRHLRNLAVDHNGVEGLGLIKIDYQDGDYRSKYATITTKGTKVLDKVLSSL